MPTNVTLAVTLEDESICSQLPLGPSRAVKNLHISMMLCEIIEIVMVQPADQSENAVGDWTLAALIKRLNDQRQLIEQIQLRLDAIHPDRVARGKQDEQRIAQLETNLEFALSANKTIVDNLVRLRAQLSQLQSENNDLRSRLEALLNEQSIHIERNSPIAFPETVLEILKALTKESNKSSTEISYAIHRSREHTARLMKRLCQMGLVVKSGPNIPARFVLTEIGKEAINSLI